MRRAFAASILILAISGRAPADDAIATDVATDDATAPPPPDPGGIDPAPDDDGVPDEVEVVDPGKGGEDVDTTGEITIEPIEPAPGGETLAAATTPPWPCPSIPDGQPRGDEQNYGNHVRLLVKLVLNKPVPSTWYPSTWYSCRPYPEMFTRGTPNHKLLLRVWYYGWALRNGTEVATARNKLLTDIFPGPTQYPSGQYAVGNGNEVLTVSHYQLWAQGVAAARIFAKKYNDTAVLAATRKWMRGEKALYDVLQRGNLIDAPGARFEVRPTPTTLTQPDPRAGLNSDLRNVNYWQYKNATFSRSSAWFDDKYNAAAWMLRELRTGLADDLGGAASAGPSDVPTLHNPLCICTRGATDFEYAFARMDGALQPMFWVQRVGSAITYGPVQAGTPNTPAAPAPKLAGAQLTAVIPGYLGGSCLDATNQPICAAP